MRPIDVLAACVLAVGAAQPLRAQATNPARDSALVAFSAIAVRVAAMRSGYDQYRKSAFNDGNGEVAARAADYGARCRELAESAKQNRHYFCRSCAEQALQAALDQYRLFLPSLEQLGSRCEARMERLKPSSHSTAATWSALRHEVVPESDRIVRGLRAYEVRVEAVRAALGATSRGSPNR